jgi:aerotaxis receptor
MRMAPEACMQRPTVAPLDRERRFDVEELFFSTTDAKGIIRVGNGVFSRVSGWSRDELRGAPHNIIRHPDMPRAAFKLLWDTIEAGQPIAAYVKNKARDGSFYWVIATVVPMPGGYLSVRFKPTTPLREVVAGVYREMRGIEASIEDGPGGRGAAMAASTTTLLEKLGSLGFADYRAFMHTFVPLEARARKAAMGDRRGPAPVAGDPALRALRERCAQVHVYASGVFDRLEGFLAVERELDSKSRFVLGLARDVRMFSNNALFASFHLGTAGAPLTVIATAMSQRSEESARLMGDLKPSIAAAMGRLKDLAFRVCVVDLQVEMALAFLDELLSGADRTGVVGDVEACLDALFGCGASGLEAVSGTLRDLERELVRVAGQVAALTELVRTIEMAQVTGKVEAARVPGAEAARLLFEEVSRRIEGSKGELGGFASIVDGTRDAARGLLVEGEKARANLTGMHVR